MAHLRTLNTSCLACNRNATVELFNSVNAPLGKFCRSCGQRKLKEQEKRERDFEFTEKRAK